MEESRMFLLSELILSIPFIAYSCLRIRNLVPGRLLKHSSVLLYLVLFLGYPFAETLSRRQPSEWTHPLMITGYYCLPYLLYITLCVVTLDIGILLARTFNLLNYEAVRSTRFRSGRLAYYLLIPALIVAFGAWHNDRLEIKEILVELPQRSSSIERLHVVFASDFHLTWITDKNLVERFVTKVNGLNPDLILIGGDVLEGDRGENLPLFEEQFRRMRSRYGVYAALGNHERRRTDAAAFFARSGMKLLRDRVELIDDLFYLAVRDTHRFKRKSINDLLQDAPRNLPVILLDHSPSDITNVSRSRVDLQLSGHTHNGQLFPVNWIVMPFEYELAWGKMRKGDTIFVVSSGVQAWGPPVKTAGDSEILSLRIKFTRTAEEPLP